MRLEFDLELVDAPGALAPVLRAIADHGANVETIVHRHELAEDDRVPVRFVVDVPEEHTLQLLNALAQSGRLLAVNHEGGPVHSTLLLMGHVFQSGFDQLLDRAWKAGARIDGVDARIASREEPSAMIVRVSADKGSELAAALASLREGAAEMELVCVEAIGGDSDV